MSARDTLAVTLLAGIAAGAIWIGVALLRGTRGEKSAVEKAPPPITAVGEAASAVEVPKLRDVPPSTPSSERPGVAIPTTEGLPTQLSAEQVSAVISMIAPVVKKRCWQPALDSRRSDDPKSVRLAVALEIDPSGKVIDVESRPIGDAYPSL